MVGVLNSQRYQFFNKYNIELSFQICHIGNPETYKRGPSLKFMSLVINLVARFLCSAFHISVDIPPCSITQLHLSFFIITTSSAPKTFSLHLQFTLHIKISMSKLLGHFLQEQQEPFERGCSRGINKSPNCSAFLKAVFGRNAFKLKGSHEDRCCSVSDVRETQGEV